MAETQQKVSELPPATVNEESPKPRPKDYWRKKLIKFSISLAVFVVIHGLMLVALDLTLLRVRRPKYRLQSVTIENLNVNNGTTPPYFHMQLNAQVTLKNNNFGSYKFDGGNLTFSYRGTPVGEAVITESSAHIRSIKTMRIVLIITSQAASRNPSLDGDISSGLVPMTANSVLRGKVRFFLVIHKKKSTNMNCDLTINLVQKVVQDLRCD